MGVSVGDLVGDIEGLAEGVVVGEEVGKKLGNLVGDMLGDVVIVGFDEGETVGVCVGLDVGSWVFFLAKTVTSPRQKVKKITATQQSFAFPPKIIVDSSQTLLLEVVVAFAV